MVNIREILSSLYANRSAEDLYVLLEQWDVLESLKRVATQLNSIIQNEEILIKDCHSLPVGHIASNLLWAVNKRIALEGNPETTKEMENILGDVCLAVLLAFLDSIKSEKSLVWMQINYALRDSCDFHNYDFNQLIRFLKIDTAASYFQSRKSADRIAYKEPIPSLCWKGKPEQLKDFLDIFIDQKIIRARKGLGKLFQNPSEPLQLQFEPELANLVVQFFYTVKHNGLVTHAGCKGFYQALEFHIVDFKKLFLKNQEARKRINSLRQSKSKWINNQQRIDSWLQLFPIHKNGRRTVPQT